MKKIFFILSSLAFTISAFGFTEDCLTSTVSLNTGVNHQAGVLYDEGEQDAYWTITEISEALDAPGVPYYGAYVLVMEDMSSWHAPWVVSPNSRWISFTEIARPSTLPPGIHRFTAERRFMVCDSTEFIINIDSIAFDQRMKLYINDSLIYQNDDIYAWSEYFTLSVTLPLGNGYHTLKAIVDNTNPSRYSKDGHGFMLVGNVSTVSGEPALLRDDPECLNYPCFFNPGDDGDPSGIEDGTGSKLGNYFLEQNAPNPFGDYTVIRYDVPLPFQRAAVVVYDWTGREVLQYPIYERGEGQITIRSSQLTPGLYWYHLQVDEKQSGIKKMVLIQ